MEVLALEALQPLIRQGVAARIEAQAVARFAARAGWSITCENIGSNCGLEVGCGEVGCDVVGPATVLALMRIVVFLNESPAYTGALEVLPYVGQFEVGAALACDPDISALKCILDRVVHAHITIDYVTSEA